MSGRGLKLTLFVALAGLLLSSGDVAFAQQNTPDILNTPISGSVAS